jgi:hypothetical protein
VINTQAVQTETLTGQIEALTARIAELERRLDADSTTSSKAPSSDPPYRRPERRSLRTASGRRPGKQPGTGGTMPLVDNPNQTLFCDVDRCGDCGSQRAQEVSMAPAMASSASPARADRWLNPIRSGGTCCRNSTR